jgi:toxin ParE1/3/4
MFQIKFTNKAKTDLEEIWEYSFDTWSEKQADKYYLEIIDKCNELKFDFEQGKDYSKIIINLKGVKINRHIIFYRLLNPEIIEIERILHEKMDLRKHLNQ